MVDVTDLPIPRITAPNWGQRLNNAITSRYLRALELIGVETAARESAVAEVTGELDVLPSGVMTGRGWFQYGPSRSVGVTAMRVHFNRIREWIGSGFFANMGVGGFGAADTATYAMGTLTRTRQASSSSEWITSSGAGTWAVKALQAAVLLTWPFGNDARLDGLATSNSTPAKAQAAAKNGLHTLLALARAEVKIESATNATYTTTNGSPNITGNVASPWFKGMLVTGAGIPANSYVGDLISGGFGGFKLSSSRSTQVDVNATASASTLLTFTPVVTGTWAGVSNTAFSGGAMVKTNSTAPTQTWVLHLPEARRVHWVTAAIDDAEYVVDGAPFGGNGGMDYSIDIDSGASVIAGTTSDQHRFGQLDLTYAPMAVDLGTLDAGEHTIVITGSGVGKVMVADSILIESLTPPTTVIMKEVELPDEYYTLNAATGASWAKTQLYNGFIDDELARWPDDDSVIVLDPVDFGYDKTLHVSDADGAWAHFNDAGEQVMALGIMAALNALPAREGLVWF